MIERLINFLTLRIAVDGMKTTMGLPEVMLGVLPGGGGLERLPALTGREEGPASKPGMYRFRQ